MCLIQSFVVWSPYEWKPWRYLSVWVLHHQSVMQTLTVMFWKNKNKFKKSATFWFKWAFLSIDRHQWLNLIIISSWKLLHLLCIADYSIGLTDKCFIFFSYKACNIHRCFQLFWLIRSLLRLKVSRAMQRMTGAHSVYVLIIKIKMRFT